jgi:hypothetical protein
MIEFAFDDDKPLLGLTWDYTCIDQVAQRNVEI